MKNILIILFCLTIISCKNDKKNETNPSIDTASMDEIIANYQVVTEGDFRMRASDYLNMDMTKSVDYGGFGGNIYDSINNANFTNMRTIEQGKLLFNDKEFLFRKNPDTTSQYKGGYVVTDPTIIKPLYSGNKTAHVVLYDKTNTNIIVDFNFKVPMYLIATTNGQFFTSESIKTEKIKWNADPNNKVGIMAIISKTSLNGLNQSYLPLADDGEETLSNLIGNLRGGGINIYLYRGTILIKKGLDNRRYKISAAAESTCMINVD